MPHTGHLTKLKGGEELLLDCVSEVIRVVVKIDGVWLSAFLIEPVLIPQVSATIMNHP